MPFASLKPKFWDDLADRQGPHKYLFNFRRIWKMTVLLTLAAALIPLIILALVDYRISQDSIESEMILRTARVVSNTRRSVSFFLTERRAALEYVGLNEKLEDLASPDHLAEILKNLKKGFGGFTDLGLINSWGLQISYAGPFELKGKDYCETEWFKAVSENGVYISDVFTGFRHVPHIVIAIKIENPSGPYILRATIDTGQFNRLLSGMELEGEGDAFVINHEGTIQTPSKTQGNVMDDIKLPVPGFSEGSQVREIRTDKTVLINGYSYIPQTPFILMVVKDKSRLIKKWHETRFQLAWFMLISVIGILAAVIGGITYLVNQIYLADKRRLMVMHEAEYSNKMSSLGRLSAGVAHEINNPLAVINEKAGLIKDLLTYKEQYAQDPKLTGLINGVLESVDRCARITRRLLNFARRSNLLDKPVDLEEITHEVLGFMGKEAEYRSLTLNVDISDDVPRFRSDPGLLQEVFLNLITNGFAAVEDGGRIDITGRIKSSKWVEVSFTDNGHGIPKEDLDRVFEPFFSTKLGKGGTGLGLSITYGLVRELQGKIEVKSKIGEGTTFTVLLPLKPIEPKDDDGPGENPETPMAGQEHRKDNSGGKTDENSAG